MIMLDRGSGIAGNGPFKAGANTQTQQPNVPGAVLAATADQEIKVEDIPF